MQIILFITAPAIIPLLIEIVQLQCPSPSSLRGHVLLSPYVALCYLFVARARCKSVGRTLEVVARKRTIIHVTERHMDIKGLSDIPPTTTTTTTTTTATMMMMGTKTTRCKYNKARQQIELKSSTRRRDTAWKLHSPRLITSQHLNIECQLSWQSNNRNNAIIVIVVISSTRSSDKQVKWQIHHRRTSKSQDGKLPVRDSLEDSIHVVQFCVRPGTGELEV